MTDENKPSIDSSETAIRDYIRGDSPTVPMTRHTEIAKAATIGPRLDVPGYDHLARILALAYDQAARGKGKERHGNGLPFDKQPIMEIARMSGLGGHIYQVMKKAQEAGTMHANGYSDAAIKEFYGVINYAAAAVKLIEEQRK
jgi:hypothetical protein